MVSQEIQAGLCVGEWPRRGAGAWPGARIEVLDSRDLKYFKNQCTAHWAAVDDPFRWREALPFARWGLCELQLMGWPLVAAAVGLALTPWWYLAFIPAILAGLIAWFFRDPPRRIPDEPGLIVSPADGKVVEITPLGAPRLCRRPGGAHRHFFDRV